MSMIQKVVKKWKLGDPAADKADLEYWLSKTPDERIAEVERLRTEYYGKDYDRRIKPVGRVCRRMPDGSLRVIRVIKFKWLRATGGRGSTPAGPETRCPSPTDRPAPTAKGGRQKPRKNRPAKRPR